MAPRPIRPPFAHPAFSLGAALLASSLAQAQGLSDPPLARPIDRRFTYVEESLHGALPGRFELEQWATWKHDTEADSSFDRIDFKTEIEYGISEGVHFAVDLVEWHWVDSATEERTKYDMSAAELKWRLSDPRHDAVGFAYKTELGLGPRMLEWENVLIVDKIVDRWEIAYNLMLGAGWEGEKTFEFEESEGELRQSLGASYEFQPTLFVGAELFYEKPLPDWEWEGRENFFLGPNLAVRGHEWALTTTALFLGSGGDDEPAFQLRVIFEVDF
ncbi:MAG TPA: hypothetical protein VFZ65_08550 [Planctomycetota bacterium]|nr:hypothetical protein [Planctomycetota bacterium]